MNSCGSRTSCCDSSSWRSHWKYCSSRSAPTRPSLYFQCAAMPSSASRCISSVRICTSNGMPRSLDDRRVERLIAVGPGHGDEVLEPARDRRPGLMDDPERRIAVLHAAGDHAQRDEVVDLIEQVDLLALELLMDRPEALDAPVDRDDRNLGVGERRGSMLLAQVLDEALGRPSAWPRHAARRAWYACGSRWRNASSSSSFFSLLMPSRLAMGA